jgi:PleD family two-component response regulator
MSKSYTPGLKILEKTVIKKERILPLKGKVHVNQDEEVNADKIVASTNGQIALEKLKTQKADLIISDWHMPVMEGLEFYKAVKKEETLKDIPFLMVTVEDSKEKVIEAMKLGIRDYIVKPLQKSSFEAKVKTLLKI